MSTSTPDQSQPSDPGQPRVDNPLEDTQPQDPALDPNRDLGTQPQDPDAEPGVVPQPHEGDDDDDEDDGKPRRGF